jgi:hypothetical protein
LRILFMIGGIVLAMPGGGIMPLSNLQMEFLGAAILVPTATAAWMLVRRAHAA